MVQQLRGCGLHVCMVEGRVCGACALHGTLCLHHDVVMHASEWVTQRSQQPDVQLSMVLSMVGCVCLACCMASFSVTQSWPVDIMPTVR
jgi:hypothetical protein